jgi:hypothetical protein
MRLFDTSFNKHFSTFDKKQRMPELIIRYKSKKTVSVLKDFAKHFNFSVVVPTKARKKIQKRNDVNIIPADNSIDTSDLERIFSGKDIDAKKIREQAWQRK